MPHQLEGLITRDDIANVAETEQLILDDDTRISVLEAMRSIDVQACPGSGKTTLIAAKLILLAKKWQFQHQGLCVLSHTNVAKDEIIERLKHSKTKEAQRLLNYPHFIGTIQEFIHRFLALPYIRSNNIRDITVDNDEYAKQAAKLLNLRQFGWLRGTLNGLGDNEAQEGFIKGTFRYITQNGKEININKIPRAWRGDANLQRAKRDLDLLKQYMDERGCFLFRDMYTHAQMAYSENSELSRALKERFLCVFIDEMQDTQKYQDELLCKIFPLDDDDDDLIVQRFGDPDQAIFHGIGSEEPNASFKEKLRDSMDFVIHRSHRFDGILADKIKALSFNEIPLETELSSEALADRTQIHAIGANFEHAIIVFNDDNRDSVVESFAQIVSSQFAIAYKSSNTFTVKVVGAVGNEINPTAEQLKIGHYWPDYNKSKSNVNYKESSLIDAVRHCHRDSSIDWSEKYKFLTGCILKLMRIAGKVDDSGRYFSASTLKDSLKANGYWDRFRKGIYFMLNDAKAIEPHVWNKVCEILKVLLGLNAIPAEATEYITFTKEVALTNAETAEDNQKANSLVSLKNNKIAHADGFHIELSTIHGVKGETHDATLIVETKNHTFDLETMLPYLTGELPNADYPNTNLADKPNSRRAFKPNKVFMRQFYVAMSRPKHLLCLAMHSDRISDDQKELLQGKGWKIEILESV